MASSAQVSAALSDQWAILRERIGELTSATLDEPSTLEGWTVRDLIAHIGRSLGVVTRCEVLGRAGPGSSAHEHILSLGAYLSGYAPDAPAIAARAREDSGRHGTDLFDSVRADADRALDRLPEVVGAGEDGLVRTNRGVLTARDLLLTRVIELVVHGYDLAPALPGPAPIDPNALRLASDALLTVLSERLGSRLLVDHDEVWVKTASGRIDWDHAVSMDPLRPEYLSDGIPDLKPYLPLL